MTPADAEAVVRRFFAAWNAGDMAAFDELIHDDFEEPWAPPPGYGRGPAGARASYAATHARLSAIHIVVEDVVAQADKVACRTTLEFTSRSDGTKGRMVGMNIFHLSDGKLGREWYVYRAVS